MRCGLLTAPAQFEFDRSAPTASLISTPETLSTSLASGTAISHRPSFSKFQALDCSSLLPIGRAGRVVSQLAPEPMFIRLSFVARHHRLQDRPGLIRPLYINERT